MISRETDTCPPYTQLGRVVENSQMVTGYTTLQLLPAVLYVRTDNKYLPVFRYPESRRKILQASPTCVRVVTR
jgi:hypothetical protein